MKIIKDYPPNYDEICKAFDVLGSKTVVFAYGDVIYAPGRKGTLPKHFKVHEGTHQKQQGDDPVGWWDKYINDPSFRLEQEIEAYRNQWSYLDRTNHNIQEKARLLDKFISDLSGPLYGNLITRGEARDLITL